MATGVFTREEGACDGQGWVIINPDWPRGTLPHRDRCSGCTRCDPKAGKDW